jgi:tetratricopeptide (TPR) repeat protein
MAADATKRCAWRPLELEKALDATKRCVWRVLELEKAVDAMNRCIGQVGAAIAGALVVVLLLGVERGARADEPVAVLFERGRLAYEAGRLVEAKVALEAVAARDPRHVDARYILGLVYLRGERYEQAASWLRAAIAIAPGEAKLHYSLGLALAERGDRAAALEAQGRATALAPRFAPAHYEIAVLHAEGGEDGAAESALARAIAADARHGKAHLKLGIVLLRRDAAADAARALEAAARLLPEDPAPRQALARAYRRLGREADADRETAAFKHLAEAERARFLDRRAKDKARQMVEAARLAADDGDKPGARALLRRALELDPGREDASRLLRELGP